MTPRGRILLIDDNPDYRLALGVRLKSYGFDVTTAGSAAEGLQHATAQSFDLILLDMRMPDQKGIAVYERLRACAPTAQTPVIIFTADFPVDYWQPIAADKDPKGFIMGKTSDHILLLTRMQELLGRDV